MMMREEDYAALQLGSHSRIWGISFPFVRGMKAKVEGGKNRKEKCVAQEVEAKTVLILIRV